MAPRRPFGESALFIGAAGVLASSANVLCGYAARQAESLEGMQGLGILGGWLVGAALLLLGAVLLIKGVSSLMGAKGPDWAVAASILSFLLAAMSTFFLGVMIHFLDPTVPLLLGAASCLVLLATATFLYGVRSDPAQASPTRAPP